MKTKLNITIIAVIQLVNSLSSAGIITEGFETFNNGTVNAQGQTWQESWCNADVVDNFSHTGQKSLVISRAGNLNVESAIWWDDLGLHTGILKFSWWMYPTTSNGNKTMYSITASGWDGEKIIDVRNDRIGSSATLDALNQDGTWTETLAIVPSLQWTQINLEMDLQSGPDRYRVSTGEGPWSSWFSLGSDETYLRKVEFGTVYNAIGTSQAYNYVIDDITFSVPEPATLLLLSIGSIFLKKRV